MTRKQQAVRKTTTLLADGRELIYFDMSTPEDRDAVDGRPLPLALPWSELRFDPRRARARKAQPRFYHRQGRLPARRGVGSPAGRQRRR